MPNYGELTHYLGYYSVYKMAIFYYIFLGDLAYSIENYNR